MHISETGGVIGAGAAVVERTGITNKGNKKRFFGGSGGNARQGRCVVGDREQIGMQPEAAARWAARFAGRRYQTSGTCPRSRRTLPAGQAAAKND